MKVTWNPNPIRYPSRVTLPALPTNRVYRFRQRWRLDNGRAVPEVLDLDTGETVEVEAHYDDAWTAVDLESGDRGTQRADSPWHPAPPKPEHRWVETTQACDRDYHFECTGCGATYTQTRDACREDEDAT